MSKKKRLKWRILALFFLIILISWGEGFVEQGIAYIQDYFFKLLMSIREFRKNLHDYLTIYKNLQEEKEYWQKEAENLYKENINLKISLENIKRMQEFSWIKNFKIENYELIPAFIIGRDPLNWNLSFRINKGRRDGIKENMPIIYKDQLIGIVEYVSENYSEIKSLFNPSFSVGVVIYETKDQGVIKGALDYMEISYLFSDNGIKNGDHVITSGVEEYIPYGLKVGCINEVNENSNYFLPKIKVLPFYDLSQLEGVVICKKL
ncbi:MAG: rod shape-determining protein MreC [Dictyoglomaceae bacterium]|nr:rod shape-determining protein MreC [Dictyoglomaceae bacterium]